MVRPQVNKVPCKDCGHDYRFHVNFYIKCSCELDEFGNPCRGVDGWCKAFNKDSRPCECAEYVVDNLQYLEAKTTEQDAQAKKDR